MKYLLLFLLIISSITRAESVLDEQELIQIKDTSGLSEDAVRAIAEKSDKEKKKNISLKQIYEITDANGSVNVAKLQALWEDLTPKTNGFDWVKTKKGEWFKGKIKAMYDEELEFDSEEMGIHVFDLEDIAYIKTHDALEVNIEEVANVSGIIRFDGEKIKIIQGDNDYEFKPEQVISFAPSGEKERNYWSGKVSLSIDQRSGNKNQFDYTTQASLKRRTDSSRLSFDYLGRISSIEGQDTANDHRITEAYDIFITRRFFWTPIAGEFYSDEFQNIATQVTASTGLGYTVFDRKKLTWDISGGPGIITTRYKTVEAGNDSSARSLSFETRTKVEYEVSKRSDLVYDHKFSFTDDDSGRYKHHMILTLENELTSWLDLDLSFIWDHLAKPTELEDGTVPFKNDYQALIGLGVEF